MYINICGHNINLLDHKQREEIKKQKDFAETNYAFNYRGNNRPSLNGYLIALVRTLNPKDADDFCAKYLRWRTRSIKEDYLLANNIPDFMKITGFSFEKSVLYLTIYLVDNTWEGAYNEENAVTGMYDYLRSHFPNHMWFIEKTDSKTDSRYAIDYLIYRDLKPVVGIQLKPRTFFNSRRSTLKEDIQRNRKLMLDYKRKTGVHVGFWLYEDIENGLKAKEVL